MAKKNALEYGGSGNSNWLKGAATIKFSGDEKRIKISYEDNNVKCSAKLLPDVPTEIHEDTEYFVEVQLDEDGEVQRIFSIRPLQWMGLKMKYADMTRPEEGAPPAPYTVEPKNEKWQPFDAFNAFMEIQEGEFAGVRVPYWMHYKFESDGKGYTRWSGNPDNKKATRVRQCVDFFTLHEAVSEPIEWPEDGNILPELHARILDAGVVVETAGRDGYITEMIEAREPIKAEKLARRQKPEVEKKDDDDEFEEEF